MTLRNRLLLLIVPLNLAVVAILQVASLWLDRDRSAGQRREHERLLQALLEDAYSRERFDEVDPRWVRKLLGLESFREVFRDVMVTTGGYGPRVDINPMGAAHRDRDRFPLDQVRQGIQRAMETGTTVAAGTGYCVPIESNGTVLAGAWYQPRALPTALPFAYFAVPLLGSTLLLGVLSFFMLGRTVVRPIRGLGRAAARVGAGEHGVRVERVPGAAELNALVDAFNTMAAKVAGHTEELEREVRRATAETERRERALVLSSRLASIGTLAAGIAHEINNPIGGMLNATHRLLQRPDLDDRSRTYLTLILEGLDRVGRIARKVLDFSPRQIEAKPFALRDAVEGAWALVEHRASRAGVQLRTELPGDLPQLVGDRHEIQQVLLNFFLNSMDEMEAAGGGGTIAVWAARDGDWMRLAVEDDGPGTDAETLSRVLDPFFSGKGRPDSSGLGLFISYSIIENHGGTMEIASEPGGGFRVSIRLPLLLG